MLDKESGVYFDYDSEDQKPTGIYCVANYIPYIVGISSDKKALELINSKLILENGVTSCQRKDDVKGSFQWGYPNALAPHQYWAYVANKKADNGAIASLIAKKYLDNVTGEFVLSGKLFEKYDAKNGGIAKVNEYGCPEMLGWTAGVFAFFHDELK